MSNLRVIVLSTNSDEAGAPLHVETLIKGLQNKIEFMVLTSAKFHVLCFVRTSIYHHMADGRQHN